MNVRNAVLCSLICLSLSAPRWVAAHAEEPISQRIYSLDDQWLLKSNFGLVGSSFEGFVCEEAFLGGDQFIAVPLDRDTWLTFGETIHRTTDGCDFELVKELVQAPSDADGRGSRVAYLANAETEAGIWLSEDAGQSFERIDFDTSEIQLTGLRFASDTRAFASGYDRSVSGLAIMLDIDFEAKTVETLTLPDNLKYPYLLAASGETVLWLSRSTTLDAMNNPVNTTHVYWGTADDPIRDDLVVETWPTGAVLSEDGQKAWLSGLEVGKGLTIGTRDPLTWTTVATETTASCVGRHQDQTYVCAMRRFDEADLVVITDEGEITLVTDFRDLEGPRDNCAEGTVSAEVCPLVWGELARYLGLEGFADVGIDMGASPDMSIESDTGTTPDTTVSGGDDGCSATGNRASPHAFLLVAIGLLGWVRRRR